MLKRTSAHEIRSGLAQRITAGDLKPGTVLDERLIASEFSVSRTPVREALRLLAASGLVQHRPHAKAVVAKPDAAELSGMFDVMSHLEALCAGLCASAMTVRERDALEVLHMAMSGIVRAGDATAYAEANDRFHAAIYDGAHNLYLAEITRATKQRLQPFRRAQFFAVGRLAQSHAEHGAVLEAILRGDRGAAETAMRTHIVRVEDSFRALQQG